jgi:Na+-transporting methylmalonyl-CoA/oxaloacetate decarboxylase gamma subunit
MLQTVLLITLIGMGLVFVAILLLWGMMELLVRLTNARSEQTPNPAALQEPSPAVVESETLPDAPQVDRKKIAVAAVAAAIQLRRRQAAEQAVRIALASAQQEGQVLPSASSTSNWQPVMRAAQMQERLRLFSRNSRRSSS